MLLLIIAYNQNFAKIVFFTSNSNVIFFFYTKKTKSIKIYQTVLYFFCNKLSLQPN